jgi:hypothetical protein
VVIRAAAAVGSVSRLAKLIRAGLRFEDELAASVVRRHVEALLVRSDVRDLLERGSLSISAAENRSSRAWLRTSLPSGE